MFCFLGICFALLANGQIGGKIFNDYNANGQRDSSNLFVETGFQGILVIAYNTAGVEAGRTTSDLNGAYSITVPTGAYRVEFSNIPTDAFVGPGGNGSGTTVQFITAPNLGVDLGITRPRDYAENNPLLATSCYVAGEQQHGIFNNRDVLISFLNSAGGTALPQGDLPMPTPLAMAHQIGSTYGLAWQASSGTLFMGAFIKAKTGLGLDTTGAIYYTNPKTGQLGLLIDINDPILTDAARPNDFGLGAAGTNPFTQDPAGAMHFSEDSIAVTNLVYRGGWGDIDISEDGTKLYALNLKNRKIYTIPIPNPVTRITSSVNIKVSPTVPAVCEATPRVRTTSLRGPHPFGLGTHGGKVYVGQRCYSGSGSVTWSAYEYDPVANTFGADRLNYAGSIGTTSQNTDGVICDLAFDSDTMILAVRLYGVDSYIGGQTGGNILRACPDGNGNWTMERNGACGGHATVGATGHLSQGPGTGEYYTGDNAPFGGGGGVEGIVGGLAQLSGATDVVVTAYDVFSTYEAGPSWLNNQTGTMTKHFRAAYIAPLDVTTVNGKNNVLGDLEYLTEPAPIQIGNRVWLDRNRNGIQDADETPIQGVAVELWADTDNDGTTDTKIGDATTNAMGQYFFGGNAKQNLSTRAVTTQKKAYGMLTNENNDGYEILSTHVTDIYDGSLFFNKVMNVGGAPILTGLRFGGLNVPQGATILNSNIAFTAEGVDPGSTGALTMTILGQAIDNAPVFVGTARNLSNRITAASDALVWNIGRWPSQAAQVTPDIKQMVQNIVNRPGWAAGNAMAFLFQNDPTSSEYRRFYAFDYGKSAVMAPMLTIEYEVSEQQSYCVEPNTRYEVRIPNVQGNVKQLTLNNLELTAANQNANLQLNSVGTAAGNHAKVTFTTGNYGQNEHRFDFGFQPSCPSNICLPVQVSRN